MTAAVSSAQRDEVVQAFEALVSGIEPTSQDGLTFDFLVSTADFTHGRGDLFVAAGLGRALAARGHGVRLSGVGDWYRSRSQDTVVVAMVAGTEIDRIPGGPAVIAWVRNRTDDWVTTPALTLCDSVVTSSELSRREIERHYDGPTGVCRIGFDPDLFFDGGGPRAVAAVSTANHWGGHRVVHEALLHLSEQEIAVDWYGVDRSGHEALSGIHRGELEYFDVPSVYRGARVTIDDMQDNSLDHGNLNSRLFEALACGSLVVVNSGLGLAEAGLGDVPVYRSSAELEEIIGRASAGEYDTLAKDLHDRVVREHSFACRAETFEALARAAVEARDERVRRASTVVNFFPDYSSTNPYQTLLYGALSQFGAVAVPRRDIFNGPVARDGHDGRRLDGQVLHLHWLNGIVQPGRNLQEAFYRLDRFKREMNDLVYRGVRIVWTVHNTLAHELTYRFLEIELSQFVADIADVVHVMTPATLAETRDLYQIPAEKVVVVEHPSFDGCYPELLDRGAARTRLSMQDDDVSVLFFGGIRPYKGVPLLLDAFEIAAAADARLRLDVAGGLGNTMNRSVVARMEELPRVVAHVRFIDDAELHVFLRAADYLVLPYENILNSGSLMLATTFGLPLVAPKLGQLKELDGAPFVEFFEAGSAPSLAAALERATVTLRSDEARRAAREFADRKPPKKIASKFARSILGMGS
ncbi:glycosyltransferase [Isoptericola sp. NPDC057391]|uniref:glycosyltransferase family protein n=1 Tax=Isoptericola sp. NPDC057391 TaxID=3346117 RepID=UPI003632E79A